MRHLEETTAFLESWVNKELYLNLRKGIVFRQVHLRVGSGSQVYASLLQSLYSLKQASLKLFETLNHLHTSLAGMQRIKAEAGIYVLCAEDKQIKKEVLASVNYMILLDDDDGSVKRSLQHQFWIRTLEDLYYFVGMKFEKSRSGFWYIIQAGTIKKVPQRFRMKESRPVVTTIGRQTFDECRSGESAAN